MSKEEEAEREKEIQEKRDSVDIVIEKHPINDNPVPLLKESIPGNASENQLNHETVIEKDQEKNNPYPTFNDATTSNKSDNNSSEGPKK